MVAQCSEVSSLAWAAATTYSRWHSRSSLSCLFAKAGTYRRISHVARVGRKRNTAYGQTLFVALAAVGAARVLGLPITFQVVPVFVHTFGTSQTEAAHSLYVSLITEGALRPDGAPNFDDASSPDTAGTSRRSNDHGYAVQSVSYASMSRTGIDRIINPTYAKQQVNVSKSDVSKSPGRVKRIVVGRENKEGRTRNKASKKLKSVGENKRQQTTDKAVVQEG